MLPLHQTHMWLGWMDLNHRIRESKSRAFTAWRHPNIVSFGAECRTRTYNSYAGRV